MNLSGGLIDRFRAGEMVQSTVRFSAVNIIKIDLSFNLITLLLSF